VVAAGVRTDSEPKCNLGGTIISANAPRLFNPIPTPCPNLRRWVEHGFLDLAAHSLRLRFRNMSSTTGQNDRVSFDDERARVARNSGSAK